MFVVRTHEAWDERLIAPDFSLRMNVGSLMDSFPVVFLLNILVPNDEEDVTARLAL